VKRLVAAFHDPDRRRLFGAMFGGKMIGIALLFAVFGGVTTYLDTRSTKAWADNTPAATAA